MNTRLKLLSVVLGCVIILSACDPTRTPEQLNTPTDFPSVNANADPLLFLIEKQNISGSFPDIHIFIDDSQSMSLDDKAGQACDPQQSRYFLAAFLYRIIDNWKTKGLINPDQITTVRLLNGSQNGGDIFDPNKGDLMSWLNTSGGGHSKSHDIVNIFSFLMGQVDVVRNNSVLVFITDGDFRNGRPDPSWKNNKSKVANGVTGLLDRDIETHFLLLCPDRLLDADLDGNVDYEMLMEWQYTMHDKRKSFVYGIDVDQNNYILPDQKRFAEKKTDVLQNILLEILSEHSGSNGTRLFVIKKDELTKNELEKEAIPQRFRDTFNQHGLALTADAQIYGINDGYGNNQWKIIDNNVIYFIRDNQQSFDVYGTVNWRIIDAGGEYQEPRILPYALFFDLQAIPYSVGDTFIVQFDDKSPNSPYYISPVDSNNCNLSHEIKVHSVQNSILLQWQYQPLAFLSNQEGAPILFVNNQFGSVSLKTKDNAIFEGDLWKNCIKVGLDFDLDYDPDDAISFIQFEENELRGLSLNINDAMLGRLYKEEKLNLLFYWGSNMDMQIADPVTMTYQRIHYPIYTGTVSVDEGKISLYYGFMPDTSYPEDYQPTLHFEETCNIYRANGYKLLGSPHPFGAADLYFTRENDRYTVGIPQIKEVSDSCKKFEVRWDTWPHKNLDGLHEPRVLYCDLVWAGDVLTRVTCEQKEKE